MTTTHRLSLAALVAVHLSADAGLIVLTDRAGGDEFFVAALFGLIVGQVVLLGLWLALAALPLLSRVLGALLAGAVLWICLVASARSPYIPDLAPLVVLAIEIVVGTLLTWGCIGPLARWLRWRIVGHHGGAEMNPRHFHLRQLLIAIGVVGVLLGVVRAMFPRGVVYFEISHRMWVELIISQAIGIGAFLVNLLGIAGGLAIVVRLAHDRSLAHDIAVGLFLPPCLAFLMTIPEVVVAGLMMGPFGFDRLPLLLTINSAQAVAISLTLIALRRLGFSFERAT
jgi:hypothetical protein